MKCFFLEKYVTILAGIKIGCQYNLNSQFIIREDFNFKCFHINFSVKRLNYYWQNFCMIIPIDLKTNLFIIPTNKTTGFFFQYLKKVPIVLQQYSQ